MIETRMIGYLSELVTSLKLRYFFSRIKEGVPYFASIDVTNACNLRCAHCYYYAKSYSSDRLTKEQWLQRIRELKKNHPSIVHCTWVGGEPLLPKYRGLVEKGVGNFKYNVIVTNGTFPIPVLKRTVLHVSIDGTEEYHDRIRGKGVYRSIKKNVAESKAKIFIHTVICEANKDCIPDLVEEWHGSNVKGVAFSFYTPLPNMEDPMWIPYAERDKVVDELISLQEKYGDFITMPSGMLDMFRSSYYRNVIDVDVYIPKNCLLKKGTVLSLDSAGNRKNPCVMGAMDCSRCGCVIPYFLHAAVVRKDADTITKFGRTLV